MSMSTVVSARQRRMPGFSSLLYIDLEALGVAASPVAVVDDFRVVGLPFSLHPHAGFAAVTFVFEDSPGPLRSRASTGEDLVVGPGGIVWTHAGSGVVHEEVPAVSGRELHGVQIFVNLSAAAKLTPPRVLHLDPDAVPVWHDDGSRVRVVVGSFAGVASPLVPVEPFTLLDVRLHRELEVGVPNGHNAVVYVLTGGVEVSSGGHGQRLEPTQSIALRGGGLLALEAQTPAHALVLAGPQIQEPVVAQRPFIMNDEAQIGDAVSRYRAGTIGHLAPS